MKVFLFFFLISCNLFAGQEIPMLYNKNYAQPHSLYEHMLIDHVKSSLERALRLESKLTGTSFLERGDFMIWQTAVPYHHLLNNLCALQGASHLHVGLLKGGSFVAALYGNQEVLKDQMGIDWFQECSEVQFYAHCSPFLDLNKCRIINSDCFKVNKGIFSAPIDIYFYDADHSLMAHEKAFTFFNDVFANVFVALVDDWKCAWIRMPTFKAFEKLGYQILYETFIPGGQDTGTGTYIGVLRKTS